LPLRSPLCWPTKYPFKCLPIGQVPRTYPAQRLSASFEFSKRRHLPPLLGKIKDHCDIWPQKRPCARNHDHALTFSKWAVKRTTSDFAVDRAKEPFSSLTAGHLLATGCHAENNLESGLLHDVDDIVAHSVEHQIADRVELQLSHDIGAVGFCGFHAETQGDRYFF
jgi:hypothetical protein